MILVCKYCKKIKKNDQWVVDVLPIEQVNFGICPQCLPKAQQPAPHQGMAYQHKKRSEK